MDPIGFYMPGPARLRSSTKKLATREAPVLASPAASSLHSNETPLLKRARSAAAASETKYVANAWSEKSPVRSTSASSLRSAVKAGGAFNMAQTMLKLKPTAVAGSGSSSEAAAPFDTSLKSSSVSRADAKKALADQLALLERLFPSTNADERANARALIIGTTKAITKLLSTTEQLEEEALSMQGTLLSQATDLRVAIQGGHQSMREMRHYYEGCLDSLASDLEEAEVTDKREYKKMRTKLTHELKTLREESREEIRRLHDAAEIADAQHRKQVSQLNEAMDKLRSEATATEQGLRQNLAREEEEKRQLSRDKVQTETQLREEQWSLKQQKKEEERKAAERIAKLQSKQQATAQAALDLEKRKEEERRVAEQTQAMMAAQMSKMQKLQEAALGMGGRSAGGAGGGRSPTSLSPDEKRNRGLLYAQLTKAKSEGKLGSVVRAAAGR